MGLDILNLPTFRDVRDVVEEHTIEELNSFMNMLGKMVAERVHEEVFEKLLLFATNLNESTEIAMVTEEEQERQLMFCVKWMFAVEQLALEFSRYEKKAKRRYEAWLAEHRKLSRAALLAQNRREYEAGRITKASIGKITKEDLMDHVIHHWTREWEMFNDVIDRVAYAKETMQNLGKDIRHRSMTLGVLKKPYRSEGY